MISETVNICNDCDNNFYPTDLNQCGECGSLDFRSDK